jgi:hypothetical protein
LHPGFKSLSRNIGLHFFEFLFCCVWDKLKSLKRLGYELDERRISVRFQVGSRGFSLLHASRLAFTPSAFYSIGNGGIIPEVKTARE